MEQAHCSVPAGPLGCLATEMAWRMAAPVTHLTHPFSSHISKQLLEGLYNLNPTAFSYGTAMRLICVVLPEMKGMLDGLSLNFVHIPVRCYANTLNHGHVQIDCVKRNLASLFV